jgi:quinol monooxygenase YgiN
MIHVIAELTIAPGKRDQVVEHARAAIAETKKEEGCIGYDLYENPHDPSRMVFVERWRDRDALNAHARAPHFKVWREATKDCFSARKIDILSDAKVESF